MTLATFAKYENGIEVRIARHLTYYTVSVIAVETTETIEWDFFDTYDEAVSCALELSAAE